MGLWRYWVGETTATTHYTPPQRIRAVSIALIRRPTDGRWLAVRGDDSLKRQPFYRPPGGGIEFGETSREAVIREMMEEFDAEIETQRLVATTENLFTFMGHRGHEVVFLWECRFVDESFYAQDEMRIVDDGDAVGIVHWIDPDELADRGIALHPDGLPEVLADWPE